MSSNRKRAALTKANNALENEKQRRMHAEFMVSCLESMAQAMAMKLEGNADMANEQLTCSMILAKKAIVRGGALPFLIIELEAFLDKEPPDVNGAKRFLEESRIKHGLPFPLPVVE